MWLSMRSLSPPPSSGAPIPGVTLSCSPPPEGISVPRLQSSKVDDPSARRAFSCGSDDLQAEPRVLRRDRHRRALGNGSGDAIVEIDIAARPRRDALAAAVRHGDDAVQPRRFGPVAAIAGTKAGLELL